MIDSTKKDNPLERKDSDIIKCTKCGHVLISGRGASLLFGNGTSIECLKCGNKYTFGEKKDD